MTEIVQAVITDKTMDRGQLRISFAGRSIALAGEALKKHQGLGKGDSVRLVIEKDEKAVAHITDIERSTVPGTDETLKTQAPIINANNNPAALAQAKAPVNAKKDPFPDATTPSSASCGVQDVAPSNVSTTATNDPPVQKVLNVTELPDSIEIGTPGKGGVIKVYFNSEFSVDAENRIKTAIALKVKANYWVEHGLDAEVPAQSLAQKEAMA